MSQGIRSVILDFDGTFTDVEKEAIPFLGAYRDGLSERAGYDLAAEWDEVEESLMHAPDEHGWRYDGKIVAPCHADPYIMSTSTAHVILDRHNLLMKEEDRLAALETTFVENYGKTANAFRPDAKATIERLLDSDLQVFVVTNSRTEAVEKKIRELAPRGIEKLRVFGEARKFNLVPPSAPSPEFDAVPESAHLPGLSRPVYLKRGQYFDRLAEVARLSGASAEETLVCGDIYELDLALPAALGCYVHLVCRPSTADYEKAEMTRLARGGHSDDLAALLRRVDL